MKFDENKKSKLFFSPAATIKFDIKGFVKNLNLFLKLQMIC